jgi:acyl dehydratase
MNTGNFSAPIDDRYLEDYTVGTMPTFGPVAVSQSDITDFAGRFDPQPIHIDRGKAQESIFGGIIASGWHTN